MKSAGRKISSPSVSLVIFGLATAYICVCGITSLWLGTEALIISVLVLLCEVAIAAEAFDLRHPSMPWFLVMWLFSVAVAATVGAGNYHTSYGPYKTATSGRFYDNIDQDAKAAVLMDAGVLSFDSTMVLDDTLSVGLALGGVTYCAAPIVSSQGSQLAAAEEGEAQKVGSAAMAVQFWAIGLDCCGSRGGFVCDNAGEAGAKSGLVWIDPSVREDPSLELRRYMQVVQASCALHDIQTVPQPLFVHWVQEPRSVLLGMFTRSMLVLVVSSVICIVVASIMVFLASYYFDVGVQAPVEEFAPDVVVHTGAGPFAMHSKHVAETEADAPVQPASSWLPSVFKSKV
mmetsp:Transcript_97804/g.273800  ORF Transcript_97804/g.273800 Transcript_97804/m.273800 type:complete len:344 (-) Transcript_97804:70-1101(-)